MKALRLTLPDGGATLTRIETEVGIDLAPDLARFPRAFTLHDDGRGLPFVSCPLTGRLSDLLLLAHEIGHASQILASPQSSLPPVQRETAAYLAEEIMLRAGPVLDAGQLADLAAAHGRRSRRIIGNGRSALLLALSDPSHPYEYGWNYPIARDLAARAAAHLSAADMWQVIAGGIDLPGLLGLPPV